MTPFDIIFGLILLVSALVGFARGASRELTSALSSRIEAAIRRTPEQWVWMHQRWKTRPSPAVPSPLPEAAPSAAR